MLTNYGLLALGIGTSILAARLLGPSGRGELAAIQLWPQQLANIALLGMPEALIYFSSRWEKDLGAALATAASLAIVAAGILSLVGFILLPTLLSSQRDAIIAASRVYLVWTFLTVGTLPLHLLRGKAQFRRWNALRLLAPAAWLVVLTLAAFLDMADPISVARLYLVAVAALCVSYIFVARRVVPGTWGARRRLVRPLLRFGLPNVLTVLPQTLNLRLDQLILAAIVRPGQLGQYVTAVAWASAIMPAIAAIAHVNFPRIANMANTGRMEILAQGVRLSILTAGLSGVFLIGITPIALPALLGDAFRPAVPVAILLTLASMVSGCNFVLQDSLRGMGRPGLVLRSELAGLLVTTSALLALLSSFELIGAAIASIIGYFAVFLVLVSVTTRAAELSAWKLLVPTLEDVRVVTGVAAGVFRSARERR